MALFFLELHNLGERRIPISSLKLLFLALISSDLALVAARLALVSSDISKMMALQHYIFAILFRMHSRQKDSMYIVSASAESRGNILSNLGNAVPNHGTGKNCSLSSEYPLLFGSRTCSRSQLVSPITFNNPSCNIHRKNIDRVDKGMTSLEKNVSISQALL